MDSNPPVSKAQVSPTTVRSISKTRNVQNNAVYGMTGTPSQGHTDGESFVKGISQKVKNLCDVVPRLLREHSIARSLLPNPSLCSSRNHGSRYWLGDPWRCFVVLLDYLWLKSASLSLSPVLFSNVEGLTTAPIATGHFNGSAL